MVRGPLTERLSQWMVNAVVDFWAIECRHDAVEWVVDYLMPHSVSEFYWRRVQPRWHHTSRD